MTYDFELEKAVKKIKESNAEKVLIQLPSGLKPKAKEIADFLESATEADIIIWAGSCYGSCDIPIEVKSIGIDLIIHFGHSEWE
ncbi:diphthamide synthesis protein [Candidatus Woesearchaeota archaeon]|nr:diphthamide synthesis protein [Candidatus Woesearchaeota archaeon]